MKYCLVFYGPGTWNTLLEEVNVCVCWVGGVCCWWSSSDKGKVTFLSEQYHQYGGRLGLGWGRMPFLFSSQDLEGAGWFGCLYVPVVWQETVDRRDCERSDFVLCLPVQGSDFGADFLKTLALWPNNVHWFLQKTAQNSLHSRQLGGD